MTNVEKVYDVVGYDARSRFASVEEARQALEEAGATPFQSPHGPHSYFELDMGEGHIAHLGLTELPNGKAVVWDSD